MLGSRPLFPLASLGVAAFLIATVPGFGEACALGATAWKIAPSGISSPTACRALR